MEAASSKGSVAVETVLRGTVVAYDKATNMAYEKAKGETSTDPTIVFAHDPTTSGKHWLQLRFL